MTTSPFGLHPALSAALFLACLLADLAAAAALPDSAADPELAEAVRWYTGVAGHMDDTRAAALLEQALADQDALSVMWLARVHSTGRMGYPKDRRRARALARSVIDDIERLAKAGDDEARFLMGTARAEGLGRRKSARQAVAWYREAAASGHVLASHNLGNALATGRGIAKDAAAATTWWRIAADAGDAVTQFRLGEAYEYGLGVTQDQAVAERWYRASAERGYAPARKALERGTVRH